jgi:hypothetical protein
MALVIGGSLATPQLKSIHVTCVTAYLRTGSRRFKGRSTMNRIRTAGDSRYF